MKKLLAALFILIGFTLYGQTPNNYVFRNTWERTHGAYADSVQHIPTFCGVPPLLTTKSWKGGGALAYDTCNNKLYGYRDTAWVFIPDSAYVASAGIDTSNAFVNYIERTPGKDSIIFWIGGSRFAIKDSTGGASLLYGNDFELDVDSLFLKGAWVNLIDYGGNPDGVTNNNAALTAAIATGKNVFVPRGRYVLSAGIQLQAGQTIFGVGYNSVFKTSANDRMLWANDNTTIAGLRFVGDGKGSGKTFQSGILLFSCIKFDISHCWFDSLAGAAQQNGGGGIYGSAISASNSAGGRISNCTFYNNNGGLVLSQRSEYITISNITAENNTVGVGIGSGNIVLNGAIIENNRTGILIYDGTNDGHGVISSVLSNHNDTSLAIRGIAHDVGFQITNSDFYYGKLSFTNSHNIRFVNCNFDQLDSVSINGSTNLQRSSCWWGKTQAGVKIPINIFNGGEDFATMGEVRYDNSTTTYWINQKKADTVLFAGQFYLTGIPNGGVAADSVLVATSTGQVKKRDAALFGNVFKVGTPANNQLGVWTGDGTIEGTNDLRYDGSELTVGVGDFAVNAGNIYASAGLIRGGWFEGVEGSAFGSVTSGMGVIWVKDNGTLHFKNESNVDIEIGHRQGTDVASLAGAISLGEGTTFEITGTNAITLISNVGLRNGFEVTLIFTSTAVLTDGTANSGTDIGMELASNTNFTGSADDVVTLVLCEIGGVQRWREKSRSVN